MSVSNRRPSELAECLGATRQVRAVRAELSRRLRPDLKPFVLLDAASVPGLPALLQELGQTHASLFRRAPDDLQRVAPYFASIDLQDHLFAWIAINEELLEKAIWLASEASFEQVYRHLRRFLYAHDSQGRLRYFRFYDRQVLETVIAAWTEDERARWMGPSSIVLWAAKKPSDVLFRSFDNPTTPAQPPDWRQPLQLSAEVEGALASAHLSRFKTELADYLRRRHPAESEELHDQGLAKLIQDCLLAGHNLGLDLSRDCSMLAELSLTRKDIGELDATPFERRRSVLAAKWREATAMYTEA